MRLITWLILAAVMLPLRVSARSITEADRLHWAFQPLRPVSVPNVDPGAGKVSRPIDRFILAQLKTKNLGFAPPANREQLIRRVTLGLTGLPPTIEEINAFLQDPAPEAFEKVVDRLLASPSYGERWGRHWLDLARFGETDGFEHDAVRPHAWRYREYVINAFNSDKPYDVFVREQIAGDELFPGRPEALVATGFNLLGPDMVDSADQVQRRHNTLNDITDTTAMVFLAQTIACARCHNHKSEPFSQRDYYELQAFFTPAKFERELPVPTPGERVALQQELAKYDALTQAQRKQVEVIEAPHRERVYAEKLAKLSEEARLAHQTPREKRTVEMENQIQETAELLKISDSELLRRMSPEDKAKRKSLLDELKRIPKPAPLPLSMALQTQPRPGKTFVLGRGDYNNPGDEVQPGFPEILRGGAVVPEGGSRTALAKWIASPTNPLTARVMVNRIWQHHFGRSLAPAASELGTRSSKPTHPDLLDWLANEFIACGWRVKHMQKLIVMSAAYRQSTTGSTEALARDPDNRLFSRQNRVRLEGEVIRDSLLAISGRLNPSVGGPSVQPPIPADLADSSKNWTPSLRQADYGRRSCYIFARRNLRFPFLEVFDAPDSNLSCPERGRSTTAPQSLTLLNSEEVMSAGDALAHRLLVLQGDSEKRIDQAFRMVLGRAPSGSESRLAHDFLKSSSSRGDSVRTLKPDDTSVMALRELCRSLFNLNAFVYVD